MGVGVVEATVYTFAGAGFAVAKLLKRSRNLFTVRATSLFSASDSTERITFSQRRCWVHLLRVADVGDLKHVTPFDLNLVEVLGDTVGNLELEKKKKRGASR